MSNEITLIRLPQNSGWNISMFKKDASGKYNSIEISNDITEESIQIQLYNNQFVLIIRDMYGKVIEQKTFVKFEEARKYALSYILSHNEQPRIISTKTTSFEKMRALKKRCLI